MKSSHTGLRHRGRHDEMLRAFRAGQQFRFDILMDIGGFRDMHRHRRCIQIEQGFTTQHGYDIPDQLEPAGALEKYKSAMDNASSSRNHVLKTAPLPKLAKARNTQFRLGSASAHFSRWILPKRFTFPNCAPARRDIFLTAMPLTQCLRKSERNIRRWPDISASTMCATS